MPALLFARRLRKPALIAAAAALASVAMIAPAPAQADTQDPSGLLLTGMQKGIGDGYPGVIGMIKDGDTVSRLFVGTGNRSTGQHADPASKFRIGSLTKAFTATVLLQLEAEGRLSLDDTVARWLPGAVNTNGYDGNRITIRQLLNHTSGLPAGYTLADLSGYWLGNDLNIVYSPQAIVTAMLNKTPPRAPENPVQAHYSNVNYLVAGMVIEAVTGHAAAAEVNSRIIQPLGLQNTSFPTTDTGMPGNFMHGYAYMFFGLNERSSSNVSLFWTAGAIISTLDDLNTFYRALFSGQLLPAAQLAELKTGVPFPKNSEGSTYGLGVIHNDHACADGSTVSMWVHTGGVIGYFTYWASNDDGSKQILMAANENHLQEDAPGAAHLIEAAGDAFCAM